MTSSRSRTSVSSYKPLMTSLISAFLAVIASIHLPRPASSMQVTLLDTTLKESLDWVTYTRQHDDPQKRGWREASYTTVAGDVYRVYMVCNVAVTAVDNWLRTPYIDRRRANRLYVDVKFTMRRCTKYPDPVRLQQCKESFKLLYYEADSDLANTMRPSWDEHSYRHVDVVAADRVFADINDAVVNAETRSVAVTQRGVYFAFYDQGACTTLLSVRVYYIACPSVLINFANFTETPAGPEMTSIVPRDGACVPHADVGDQRPSYLCKADGNWYYATGTCRCQPGHQPLDDVQCTACSSGTYKWLAGDSACMVCPANSQSTASAAIQCRCVSGFYRSPDDDKALACTQPPSPVRDLAMTYRDQSSVRLQWLPPARDGGRSDVRYRVECVDCNEHVSYTPSQSDLHGTAVLVSGLRASSAYELIVYAENGVTLPSGTISASNIDVITDVAVPPKVRNLRFVNIGAQFVSLAWDVAEERHDVTYDVSYYVEDSAPDNASEVITKQPNVTLDRLLPQTKYAFRVRAKSGDSLGEFSDTIYATTGLNSHHLADSPVGIIVGSAVAVLLCMLIVIIMIIIFLRRNQRSCNEKHPNDFDALHYNTVHCSHALDGSHVPNGIMTLPLYVAAGSVRTYVDPYTYEDPHQAVREFAKEIDTSLITIESVIGGGEFGDVCKGKLKRQVGCESLTVAIKTLKAGASDKNRLDFLTEASIMGQFDDPNVIYLEGVVTRSHPIMIVTEFMDNGSLDSFLRNNDGMCTTIQLVGMLRGIASGMRYLSDMGYVHRDLAARNILVSETLVCKVADFGLSREIENDSMDGGEYTTKGGKIPVRWTAPEAIAYRKFTSASDVWSYGVVTWEVISYGERPYWSWPNQDVISAVNRGFNLPPPMDCPESIYALMLECWQLDRAARPRFTAVVKTLDKLIRTPELLKPLAKPRPQCSQLLLACDDIDDPATVPLESAADWLASIKMDRYTEQFTSAGILTVDDAAQLMLKDIVELGVTLVGHQKKIMNSVQALHVQRQQQQHILAAAAGGFSDDEPTGSSCLI